MPGGAADEIIYGTVMKFVEKVFTQIARDTTQGIVEAPTEDVAILKVAIKAIADIDEEVRRRTPDPAPSAA